MKDLLMGHEREGARANYSYDDETIREAYISAFEFLSINGIQSREDLATIKEGMKKQENYLVSLIAEMKERNDKLEAKLTEMGVDVSTIKKTMTNIEEEQRNQAFEILELQDKAKIKPKPLKKFD